MPAFTDKLDIANRALQHLRKSRITSFTNSSKEAREIAAAYDRLREAEMETNLWRFSTRRAILYAVTTSTQLWTPPAYDAATTYAGGRIVTYGGEWWHSKVAGNLGNTPDAGIYWRRYSGVDTLNAWDSGTTYFAGDLVSDTGPTYFLSLINGNVAVTGTAGSWLQIFGTAATLHILYPLGAGPASNTDTRNIFRLPVGFLRMAPTDPKADAYPTLGMPSGLVRQDWVIENDYIVTAQSTALVIRFVANLIDVFEWDALFCEMFAARIADELGPTLVDDEKLLSLLLAGAQRHYRASRRRAIGTNMIEIGPIARYIDDLIAVRN